MTFDGYPPAQQARGAAMHVDQLFVFVFVLKHWCGVLEAATSTAAGEDATRTMCTNSMMSFASSTEVRSHY
jgi:hypothetical protein